MTKPYFPRWTRLANGCRSIALALFISGCGVAPNLGNSQSGTAADLAETGRVYALVPNERDADALRRAAMDLNYTVTAEVDLPALDLIMVPIDLPDGVSGAQAIEALEADVPTSTVGVNHAYRLQSSASPAARRNYATAMLDWPASGCMAKTSLGLIDGGVDTRAPALRDARIVQQQFGNGSRSAMRHGTEVASVLADPARLRGVELYSANVISSGPGGGDMAGAASIVQALDWLAGQDVRIVNISLAGPFNKLLAQAVEAASDTGMVMVAAAGNDRRIAPLQYPAALPSVVAVTAVDAQGEVMETAVRGSHIDFAAPGVDIFVTSSFGQRYVTGTSMAAPFVTMRFATNGDMRREALIAGAIDLGPSGKDEVFGHGLVQASGACAKPIADIPSN